MSHHLSGESLTPSTCPAVSPRSHSSVGEDLIEGAPPARASQLRHHGWPGRGAVPGAFPTLTVWHGRARPVVAVGRATQAGPRGRFGQVAMASCRPRHCACRPELAQWPKLKFFMFSNSYKFQKLAPNSKMHRNLYKKQKNTK
jgi:hypothetical protein